MPNIIENRKEVPFEQKLAWELIYGNCVAQSSTDDIYPCPHEGIILLGYKDTEPIYRCMFCNETIEKPETLENCIIIDATRYSLVNSLQDETEIYNKLCMVRTQVMKMLQYYPGLNNQEFECMMNQNFGGRPSYQKKIR